MKRLLLALLVCAACKHSASSSSSTHSETQTVTDTKTESSGATTTTTTVTEAPGETTTTVSEYGPPEPPNRGTPDALEPSPAPLPHGVNGGTPKLPRHGPLVKRTVTVTRSGGEKTETRQEATAQSTGATETKAAGKSDVQTKAQTASAPSASCIGASWIWGLAVLVGVVGIVWFAVKMRKAV